VSTLVGGLVAAGLLERRPHPVDRRAARLALTDAATARLQRLRDERNRLLAAALAELDGADVAALRSAVPALEALLVALERQA
jgi:DNA-binding MarR family transcriptional regulator